MVSLVFTAAFKFPFILLVTKPTLNFSITCQRNIGATFIYQCYLPFSISCHAVTQLSRQSNLLTNINEFGTFSQSISMGIYILFSK